MKEEDLLADVIAAPNDDAPRLVYADFLQERGDVLQGELIIVQCERERLEREEKTTTLEYRRARWRERSLLARMEGDYRRGFVHRLSVPTPTADALRAMAKQPLAPLLESIVFRGDGSLTLDAQAAFAIAPDLPADEPLWISGSGLPHALLVPAVRTVRYLLPTDQTIRQLIEGKPPNLRGVRCPNGLSYTAGAFEQYVKTPSFARLEHLNMWRLEHREAQDFIERAPPAKHLTIVTEDPAPLWMSSAFHKSQARAHVRELHISVAYQLEDVALLARDAVHLEQWTAPYGTYPDAREAVAKGPLTKRLRQLEMSFGGSPNVADLITAPWERLTSLALGNATIGPEIVHAEALESLVELRLFGCEIAGDVEAAIRARWPHARIE